MDEELLMVFAKVPVPGSCKTRLAVRFGHDAAAELAEAFLVTTLRRFGGPNGSRCVEYHFAPPELQVRAREIAGSRAESIPQVEGDLGARMSHAFRRGFSRGPRRVVCIGADSPHLPESIVDQAFQRLAEVPVVLGPAEDGGYYLIGLTGSHDALFDAIPWSTDRVLKVTLDRCAREGLGAELLPPFYDVDEPDELVRLAKYLEESGDEPDLLALCTDVLDGK